MKNKSVELLFEYLRSIFNEQYDTTLDVEKLDEDLVQLGIGIKYFTQCVAECNKIAKALVRRNH